MERLHGMFGLAVWDARRRRLLLARDRVGKKPLYYAERDGSARASPPSSRPCSRTPDVPRDVDHRALDAFLAYRWVPAPMTAFRAVRKLPPGQHAGLRGRARDGRALLAAGLRAQARGRRSARGPRGAARAHPRRHRPAADLRRAARRVPLRRRRLGRGGGRDGRGLVAAGEDVLDRLHAREVRRAAARAPGRRALRHRPPRARRRAAGDGADPADRAPLRRAVRRRLGDPVVLPRRDGPAPRHGRAQRRRRRRELRRLHALRRQPGRRPRWSGSRSPCGGRSPPPACASPRAATIDSWPQPRAAAGARRSRSTRPGATSPT